MRVYKKGVCWEYYNEGRFHKWDIIISGRRDCIGEGLSGKVIIRVCHIMPYVYS